MDKIFEVTAGKGGNAFLLLGDKKTALVDCGMAYCAAALLANIRQVLKGKLLDYILLSHSHYDHIGAVPYLKQAWPDCKVLAAEHAQRVLARPNALRTIRQLSRQAAELYVSGSLAPYDDKLLAVDAVIRDGDMLNLGGMWVKTIETPGHTKCSLAFLVNNETLFASESTGYMSKSGKIYPAFITSLTQALDSIRKCQALNPRFIISPHYGLVSDKDARNYWRNCILAVQDTQKYILALFDQGYSEQQILSKYEQNFRDAQSRLEQPLNAFELNARAMIKTVLAARLHQEQAM